MSVRHSKHISFCSWVSCSSRSRVLCIVCVCVAAANEYGWPTSLYTIFVVVRSSTTLVAFAARWSHERQTLVWSFVRSTLPRGENGPAQIRHFLIASGAWVPAVFLTLMSGRFHAAWVKYQGSAASSIATCQILTLMLLQCLPHECPNGSVQLQKVARLGNPPHLILPLIA